MQVLDDYRRYSEVTDPGVHTPLYAALPTDLQDLCARIKQQLIHPLDIGQYPELAGKGSEDETLYSVQEMLAELQKRNPRGLVADRKPAERLRVSCRFHALLLASILKSRGIPCRLRVGFASYLSPPGMGLSCDHWLCEVWDSSQEKWVLVDPDKQLVDVRPGTFQTAGVVWNGVLRGEADPQRYGVWKWWGKEYIKANLLHDFHCINNREPIYWEGCLLARKNLADYGLEERELLEGIARLLSDVDKNWSTLRAFAADPRLGDIIDYPRYRE